MKIIYFRHGESKANLEKLVAGQMDYDLTNRGIDQAKQLKEQLSKYNFTKIYSSPLKRAYNTALNATNNETEIIKVKCFIEMCFGEYEGRLIKEIKEFFGDLKYRYIKAPKNGENFRNFSKRYTECFVDLLNENRDDDTVVLSLHWNGIRVIDGILKELTPEETIYTKVENAKLYVYEDTIDNINLKAKQFIDRVEKYNP